MDELEDLTLPQGQSPVIDSVKAAGRLSMNLLLARRIFDGCKFTMDSVSNATPECRGSALCVVIGAYCANAVNRIQHVNG